MPHIDRIIIWITALGVLIAGVSLALYVHHEQVHGEITMPVMSIVLVLIFIVGCGVIGWAVYRNLKDVHRAKDLEAQIVTIKNNHKAESERTVKGHNAESAHKDTFCASAYAEARKLENDLIQMTAQHQSELDNRQRGWEERTGEREKYWNMRLADLTKDRDFALSPLQLEAFRCAKKLRDWIAAVGSLATPPAIAGESDEDREGRIQSAHAAYRARLRFQYESEYRATVQVIYSKFAIENIRDLWIEQFVERVECNQQVLNIADGLEALAIRQFAPTASSLIERKLRPVNETSEP